MACDDAGMETIMLRRRVIEREFQEPLRDVVSGFVEMGYSHRMIAQALDVTAVSLRRFMERRGLRMASNPHVLAAPRGRPRRDGSGAWMKG